MKHAAKYLGTTALTAFAAFTAGFCYEVGRKMGQDDRWKSAAPAQYMSGMGLNIYKLLQDQKGKHSSQ